MKTCIPPPATTNGKPAATTSTPHSTPPIILAAELHVTRADNAETIQAMRQIATERKTKTPAGSSCGSVFQNPSPTCSAGKLIDDAGLKGTRIGHAEISQRHANYIINLGSASSDDILHLIDLARHTVLRQFGIEMELEVQIVT
jgi:UDP-N-acetylmuramate dehydrogenase